MDNVKIVKSKGRVGDELLKAACKNNSIFGTWKQKHYIVAFLDAPDCRLLFACSTDSTIREFYGSLGVEPFTQKPITEFASKVDDEFRNHIFNWNHDGISDSNFKDCIQKIYEKIRDMVVDTSELKAFYNTG